MRCTVSLFLVVLAPVVCLGQSEEEIKVTIAYLQALQQGDGGFVSASNVGKGEKSDPSSLRATSAAVRALKYFGGNAPDRDKAAKFAAKCYDDAVGAFADAPNGKVDVFSTSIGLMAVVELGLDSDKYSPKALKYLAENAKNFEQIRIAAAGFEAVKKHPPDEVTHRWLKIVSDLRNKDYTTGNGDGKTRDTGSAIALQLRLGAGVDRTKELEATLIGGQRDDGGYGKAGVKGSDLETCYRVMRANHMLRQRPKDVDKMRAYIAKCRNTDGGYGVEPGKPSTVGGTYYAGIILYWLK